MGLWEHLNNPDFNFTEFSEIKNKEVGYPSFTMSPKRWIETVNSIGIISKGGRYSIGTFAHPDIAFEFASWLSPEFKLYLIKEFERLKRNEADLLNVALFEMTAKEWKNKNPNIKGNQRDFANIRQLLVLSNLESLNATMINDNIPQKERLIKLNSVAIKQLKILENDKSLDYIERKILPQKIQAK